MLESPEERWIIDCKFYRDLFQRHHLSGKETFRSSHLYQLFCYLKNKAAQPGWENVRGMLLYPVTSTPVDETVVLSGHPIRIVTLNLNQPWVGIDRDLRALFALP